VWRHDSTAGYVSETLTTPLPPPLPSPPTMMMMMMMMMMCDDGAGAVLSRHYNVGDITGHACVRAGHVPCVWRMVLALDAADVP
jgi:hypothetical protein